MRTRHIILYSLFFILFFSLVPMRQEMVHAADYIYEKTLIGSNSRGTQIEVSIKFLPEGLKDDKPTIEYENLYLLEVEVELLALGDDARDIHDLSVYVRLLDPSDIPSTGDDLIDSYLSDATSYYGGFIQDKDNKYKEVNDTQTYKFNVTSSGAFDSSKDLKLALKVKAKEDIQYSTDPESEFVKMEFDVIQNPDSVPVVIVLRDLSASENTYNTTRFGSSSAGTNVITTLIFEHSAEGNATVPEFTFGGIYYLQVYFTVYNLGTDIIDIHDIKAEIEIKGGTMFISESTYYEATIMNNTAIGAGDTTVLQTRILTSEYADNKECDLTVKIKAKENKNLAIDPTIDDIEYKIKVVLDPGEGGDVSLSFNLILFAMSGVLVLLVRRRKRFEI
ncbi:MAG: hypothetical protein KAR35_01055 [Candidatus Heimdallarchaeota archaeon]|nr:hypothetical protein [Candidatus Heimdallarchaeota archaeon]MCK5047942.1 hypothetical protein [Candidatus Heimdallarchaeota archaeon]